MAFTAEAQPSREYELKSVFLYNFSKFTDWPADAFPDANAPLVIGILGKDPFGSALEQSVAGEKVNGRSIAIAHFRRAEEIKDCQILFIASEEVKRLPEILNNLRGRSVLTVSDIDNFAVHGRMVQFVTTNNRIHLKINLEAVKAARLAMSSKVLRAADTSVSENKKP